MKDRRQIVRQVLRGSAVAVVLVLIAAVVGTNVVLRQSLPEYGGEVQIAGLDQPVTITRDERGVPTITADTARDLFLAQGYTDAQDRFFLMDYRRHVASGQLAELVGDDARAIAADKVIRTLGWRDIAQEELHLLKPATRQYLEAYASGVNAYLAGRSPRDIAVEYSVLGLKVPVSTPRPWEPVDSLVWLKAMAWDLRSNYDEELGRAEAYESLRDVALVEQLYPEYDYSTNSAILVDGMAVPPGAPDSETADPSATDDEAAAASAQYGALENPQMQAALAAAASALEQVPHLVGEGEGVGSNSWAVSGRYTESGEPLLANDPHLSVSVPGIWSQVGLRCEEVTEECPFDVSGFSLAGFPGVIIGHNQNVAWGLTNMGADVSDFFLERVVNDGALVDGEAEAMKSRTEVIAVAGADPVTITVRSTRHGPIISDVMDMGGVGSTPVGGSGGTYQVSLAWTALNPGYTAEAVFAFDRATNVADLRAAAESFDAPTQNVLFATTAGHIGYIAAGEVPIRADVANSPLPSDGSWPRPGWDSQYDWQGFVANQDMPVVVDPPEGYLVAANQAVNTPGVGPWLGGDFDYGYRAQQIRTRLVALIEDHKVTVADMEETARDDSFVGADLLVPALLAIDVEDDFDDDGQQLLRHWDRRMTADSAAAMYFAAVWRNVLDGAFSDDLPASADLSGDSRSVALMAEILDEPGSIWWDDRTTPRVVEGRDEILSDALVEARLQLTAQLGRDPEQWSWGALHQAELEHPVLGDVALVQWLVNPEPVPVSGGGAVVNATAWDAASDSFTVVSGPSMRMVVDLSDLDSSTWVNLTGTCGHPMSEHYDDQLTAWSQGEYYPWPYSDVAVNADAVTRLTLLP